MPEEKPETKENVINEDSIQITEEKVISEAPQEITQNEIDNSNSQLHQEVDEIVGKNKNNFLKKILLIVIGFLLIIIILGLVLFLLGVFDPKEEHEETTQTEVIAPVEEKKVETYKFDIKDINSKKLNEQLAVLTNKNINPEKENTENENKLIEEKNIEQDKIREEKQALMEKKLLLENEKAQLEALKQEAMNMKQKLQESNVNTDHLKVEGINHSKTEPAHLENNKTESVVQNSENEVKFLKFISVAKIKGQLYKKYLDKLVAINPNINLCRDSKNKIELFYGPFEDEEGRVKLLEKLTKNGFSEAYGLEFTKEEFDRECNY